ncbi:oligosaccharide flippase family protein [Methanocella paludicola]|uniref:oligosaccharide flippase family protein n=1 Tax=Methanocella paludicola TaxID=570267 RepID=UPI000FFB5AE5|nr:oligosaccharide flippase family protein [Methanocella paludicola]
MEYKYITLAAISRTYRFVFHKDLNKDFLLFLKNLTYVVSGALPSIVLLAIFNILAARLLGPAEYGKYTLIQSIAAFIGLPMIMGYHTTIAKFLPESKDYATISKTVSSAYIMTLLFTLATIAVCLTFMQDLSKAFNILPEFLMLAIMFAVLYTFYLLNMNTIRGLMEMKLYSIFQVAYAALVLAIFLISVLGGPITFQSILYPIFISYGVTGAAIFLLIRKYLVLKIDRSWLFRLTKYSIICVVGAVSYTVYSNISQVLIHIYMTPHDLGIYSAYSLAAISVTSLMISTFITVFFPTASQYNDKGPIFTMFFKLLPFIVILGIPMLIFSEIVVLFLYGNQYTTYLDLVLLFSVAGVSQSIQNLYGWILNTDSDRGVKISSAGGIILAVAALVLNLVLIPVWGIRGAVIALILSYLATFLIMTWLTNRYYRTGDLVAGN